MARNPFVYSRDQKENDTEFGWGAGMYPDPRFDYSDGGAKSRVPIADPTATDQQRQLREIRRMDVNDPMDKPSPYVAGNTDRFGAAPPLVRETCRPRYTRTPQNPPPRMRRSW